MHMIVSEPQKIQKCFTADCFSDVLLPRFEQKKTKYSKSVKLN